MLSFVYLYPLYALSLSLTLIFSFPLQIPVIFFVSDCLKCGDIEQNELFTDSV